MIKYAKRLESVEEYYFSKKLREVKSLIKKGKPIINLGVGSPDLLPPNDVINALKKSIGDPDSNRYQSYSGIEELRISISNFYKKKFNVELNYDSEILPLLGSKEGIMHISLAFLNPGDSVLIPNPGYPTYASISKLVEANLIYYDLNSENDWFPNIDSLKKMNLDKVKLMWINYPNMPTGSKCDKNDFKKLIQFTQKHNILLVNDNPYSLILNDSPLSIFNVSGAKKNCLELNSLSKSYNMSGWRVGMVLGSDINISKILKVKSNMDSGMFYPVQKGAIAALNSSDKWFKSINKIYTERRLYVWELAQKLNCKVDENASGMFVWAKINNDMSSTEFTDKLLYDHDIFITPGNIFGTNGNGYVRFSLCAKKEVIINAINRING